MEKIKITFKKYVLKISGRSDYSPRYSSVNKLEVLIAIVVFPIFIVYTIILSPLAILASWLNKT